MCTYHRLQFNKIHIIIYYVYSLVIELYSSLRRGLGITIFTNRKLLVIIGIYIFFYQITVKKMFPTIFNGVFYQVLLIKTVQ